MHKIQNDDVKFSDTEVLAYELFNAKNEFEKFLVDHPFTDENSEKVKKNENGKTWEEIKFKDDDLNEEYIKLKQKYDDEYEKYLQLRKIQIKTLDDFKEVFDLVKGQRGRRFVQNENLCVAQKTADNLDQRLFGNGKCACLPA